MTKRAKPPQAVEPKRKERPRTHAPNPKRSDAEVEAALRVWVWTRSIRKAAEALTPPVEEGTVSKWRAARPELWQELEHAYARELKELRPGLVREAIDKLAIAIADAGAKLASGMCDAKEVAALGRFLVEAVAQLDRLMRLDSGEPTAHVQVSGTPQEIAESLFADMLQDVATATMLCELVDRYRATR